jgi:hypothetical protein
MSKTAPIPFKPLNFDATFDATAAAVREVSQKHNIPSLMFPKDQGRAGEGAIVPPPPMPTPTPTRAPAVSKVFKRFAVDLPHYLITELKTVAATKDTSARFLIMDALKKAGYHINHADMIEDRRSTQ